MQSIAISRLHWKEFRTQGVIWGALFAMSIIFAVAVIVLVDIDNLGIAIDSLIFAAPALFALACGAFTFASEDESGTISMLRRLPINSRDLLRAKLGFGLTGLGLFYVVFAAVVWFITVQVKSTSPSAPAHLHYAFWGLEALLWSAFFSMRTRSSFAAATWGAATVALITLVFEVFGYSNWYYEIGLLLARIILLGYVAARLLPQSAEWFHDFEIPTRATPLSWLIQRVHRIPREVGRVLWLSWRENRTLILICAAVVATALIVAFFFYMNGRFEYAEFLAQGSGYYTNWRQPIPYTLPPYFSMAVAATVIGVILFAALGLIVYGTTRQLRGVPLLVNQGISARLVALVRTLLFIGLAATIWAATGIAALLQMTSNMGRESYDANLILVFAIMLPFWCFVGAYWTSFHSNKKVLAYLIGIILGLAAASLQFVLAQARINLILFAWLGIATIGYTLLFAPGWALQRRNRFRRLASWSLFSLALGGIYAGVAFHRTVDVPDISKIETNIPVPHDIPRVSYVVAPNKIDIRDALGVVGPDPDSLISTIWRIGRQVPYISPEYFHDWLTTDPTSLKWETKSLAKVQLIYRVFLELEPQIQWARDKLLSENCVIEVGTESGEQSQEWLVLGVYAKLKESKPDEALTYIESMIVGSRNLRFYFFHRPESVGQFSRTIMGSVPEDTVFKLLDEWANHPSVKRDPGLLRRAIEIIPKPDEGRELAIHGIQRIKDRLKSRDFGGATSWTPIDDRVQMVSRMALPWEERRRNIMIDYAADLAYRSWSNPGLFARRQTQEEMDRFGHDFSGSFYKPFSFGQQKESRIAVRQMLEQALRNADPTPN